MIRAKITRGEMTRIFRLFVVLLPLLWLTACASTKPDSGDMVTFDEASEQSEQIKNIDPYESFNRKVYQFNADFDKALGKPVAQAYVRYIPGVVRTGVRNFFSNLWEPGSMVNALLQWKVDKAVSTTTRFFLNSTVGVLGLFDVASKLGVMEQEEDFGQTLAVWGVADGPYLMMPFLGPTNVRDFSGLVTEWYTVDLVPILFRDGAWLALVSLRLLDSRASVLGLDETIELQIDPYIFLREAYMQSRLVQIHDGMPPQEEDPFEAELFDE